MVLETWDHLIVEAPVGGMMNIDTKYSVDIWCEISVSSTVYGVKYVMLCRNSISIK